MAWNLQRSACLCWDSWDVSPAPLYLATDSYPLASALHPLSLSLPTRSLTLPQTDPLLLFGCQEACLCHLGAVHTASSAHTTESGKRRSPERRLIGPCSSTEGGSTGVLPRQLKGANCLCGHPRGGLAPLTAELPWKCWSCKTPRTVPLAAGTAASPPGHVEMAEDHLEFPNACESRTVNANHLSCTFTGWSSNCIIVSSTLWSVQKKGRGAKWSGKLLTDLALQEAWEGRENPTSASREANCSMFQHLCLCTGSEEKGCLQ